MKMFSMKSYNDYLIMVSDFRPCGGPCGRWRHLIKLDFFTQCATWSVIIKTINLRSRRPIVVS
uniref:Putative ovule protein n=1 Tax=Solanum chacoense TaxID=4108 RepID=A0A0V0GMD3_SOLCH